MDKHEVKVPGAQPLKLPPHFRAEKEGKRLMPPPEPPAGEVVDWKAVNVHGDL
jgi:hypothetical protein